jgi:trehalose 6-phosphate phosphatase
MKHILSPANVEVLAQFAWSHVLLAFDFDGTLAPIVAEREEARMRSSTSALFDDLCDLYPCAVISGRARADVTRRTDGAALAHVLGNHGVEPDVHKGRFEQQIAEIRPLLQNALAELGGVDIEDKCFSLAIHYRRSRAKRLARKRIYDAVAALGGNLRTIPGKLVVNVLPQGAPHKGTALVRLRAQEGADTAVYVGDDVTDEDVFELDQPGRLLCIRIGRSLKSAAPYYLRNQREIDGFLRRLIAFRSERREGRGARR